MSRRRSFFIAYKPGKKPVQLQSLSAHERLPWVAKGYGCFEFQVSERDIKEIHDPDGFWFGAHPVDIDAFAEFVLPRSIMRAEDAIDAFVLKLLRADKQVAP